MYTIWLGLLVLFFLDNFLELDEKTLGFVLLLSVLIPLVFWLMDFYWRKALLDVSWRQKIISLFVNNKALVPFTKMLFKCNDLVIALSILHIMTIKSINSIIL